MTGLTVITGFDFLSGGAWFADLCFYSRVTASLHIDLLRSEGIECDCEIRGHSGYSYFTDIDSAVVRPVVSIRTQRILRLRPQRISRATAV